MPQKPQTQETPGAPAAGEPRSERLEFKPYIGEADLPKFKILGPGKPAKGIPPRIHYGEPRFIVARGERGTYKVLAFYASPRGVVRKLWAVIKPSANRPKDLATLEKLKAARIPGAF